VTMGVWQGVAMDSLQPYPKRTMPYPSMPCRQATPKTAVYTPLDTPGRTISLIVVDDKDVIHFCQSYLLGKNKSNS
jgi:hypothetical protein